MPRWETPLLKSECRGLDTLPHPKEESQTTSTTALLSASAAPTPPPPPPPPPGGLGDPVWRSSDQLSSHPPSQGSGLDRPLLAPPRPAGSAPLGNPVSPAACAQVADLSSSHRLLGLRLGPGSRSPGSRPARQPPPLLQFLLTLHSPPASSLILGDPPPRPGAASCSFSPASPGRAHSGLRGSPPPSPSPHSVSFQPLGGTYPLSGNPFSDSRPALSGPGPPSLPPSPPRPPAPRQDLGCALPGARGPCDSDVNRRVASLRTLGPRPPVP